MLREPAASEFEVVSNGASTSVDAELYAEGILTSSATVACQTSPLIFQNPLFMETHYKNENQL